MEGEGWVEWESRQGNKHMTYDNEINTVEEAKKKGYSNVSSVMDSFSYSDDKGMHQMRADGNIVEQGGNVVDLNNNETYRTTDGTFFSKNKTGREQLLAVGGAFGDFITLLGIITLQPEIVAVGTFIGNGTLAGDIANTFETQGFNESTMIDGASKVALNRAGHYLGNAGVKASRTVAGEGANKVTESVIQGSIELKTKVGGIIIDEARKK